MAKQLNVILDDEDHAIAVTLGILVLTACDTPPQADSEALCRAYVDRAERYAQALD